MKSFHNTTNESGATLEDYESKALTQDEAILAYFHKYDNLGVTPERVLRHFKIMEKLSERKWHNTPITSIRRSFSNLSFGLNPKIRKTDKMIMGDYGRKVYVWELCK